MAPRRATAVGYVLASVLAFYAHYFAAFVMLVQLLTLLALRRRGAFTKRWSAIALVIALACAPEAYVAATRGAGPIGWLKRRRCASRPRSSPR